VDGRQKTDHFLAVFGSWPSVARERGDPKQALSRFGLLRCLLWFGGSLSLLYDFDRFGKIIGFMFHFALFIRYSGYITSRFMGFRDKHSPHVVRKFFIFIGL
jgi:hypothetical protein